MKAVQSQYQRQPGPSSKRNLETSIDYHEAMAEMARAELKLHDEVWRLLTVAASHAVTVIVKGESIWSS
jgi:hypothetical protein